MEINSLAGLFFEITDVVFLPFFEPSPPHYSQRIDANTDATNKTTNTTHTTTYHHIPTQRTTTKHITHFQHRYRPTPFQVARGVHDANMSDRQGMGHGPCTLALGASQSCAYTESRLDEWSLSLLLREKRKKERDTRRRERETREEERGRHEWRETREEKRETLPCVRWKRSRVYVQDARVLWRHDTRHDHCVSLLVFLFCFVLSCLLCFFVFLQPPWKQPTPQKTIPKTNLKKKSHRIIKKQITKNKKHTDS